MTGEHGLILVFQDKVRRCVLRGVPRMSFVDRENAPVPLAVTSANQYVPAIRPRPVRLTPGHRAYVLVAKYRCDLGDRRMATVGHVFLPSSRVPMNLTVKSVGISSCSGSLHGPGQSIAISPFVAHTRRFYLRRAGY